MSELPFLTILGISVAIGSVLILMLLRQLNPGVKACGAASVTRNMTRQGRARNSKPPVMLAVQRVFGENGNKTRTGTS
jgi:hypothetical protein